MHDTSILVVKVLAMVHRAAVVPTTIQRASAELRNAATRERRTLKQTNAHTNLPHEEVADAPVVREHVFVLRAVRPNLHAQSEQTNATKGVT